MAHSTQIKGAVSELTATVALLSNGWEVSLPVVDEVYDLIVKEPISGVFKTVQVKTIRRREDRGNEMVVYAKKGNGEAYTPAEVDYIIGVEGENVYMFECTGKREYWAGDASAAKRWVKFTAEDCVEPTAI